MLVKKNVLNEINKEGTFTQGFKDCKKIKRKVSQNSDNLQNGAIALSYPPRVRVRATAKLSAAFFHDESSITIGGGGGVRKCNSAFKTC